MMDFFDNQIIGYMKASEEMRQKSKDHWLKIYVDSINNKANDDISPRVLANMMVVDSGLYKVELEED